MDLLDLELTKLLEIDARRSNTELAKQLHTSTATVRRRVKRLIESDTIRVVALANPEKTGFPLEALICLKTTNSQVDSIVRSLFEKPEVVWVASTVGRFDVICSARFGDNSGLAQFLKVDLPKLEGITMTETFIFLEVLVGNVGRLRNVGG